MAMTLDITAELEHQILREARRKGLDAKGFVLGLLRDYLTAEEASSSAGRNESELLEEINQGFPAEHWKRYGDLVAKRRAETLTAEEHAEMLAMIQVREEANVHRVECLAELAKLRQVSLRVLMDQMGIEPTIDD
ncbi:MAG: STAS/SEC14 domain-containing protein [bacterium]|nr:STAS/SEC14 domain-containing protein [bacterium]